MLKCANDAKEGDEDDEGSANNIQCLLQHRITAPAVSALALNSTKSAKQLLN